MTWIATPPVAGETNLDRVLGLLPAARDRFRALHDRLWDGSVLSPLIIELCRLRIAKIMGCAAQEKLRHPAAIAAGLGKDKIAALASYATSPLFTTLERSCIAFAEQYVMDPHGLTDDDFTNLRAIMNERQIAALVLAAATFDATIRMNLALGAAAEDAA